MATNVACMFATYDCLSSGHLDERGVLAPDLHVAHFFENFKFYNLKFKRIREKNLENK